ncbi:MAG: 3-dehydroquinate synthase [Planctomycetota bacterium]|jgi:3-dehydroquinate synthase
MSARIDVAISEQPYSILIEPGLVARLADAAGLAAGGPLVLVHDARLAETHAATAIDALVANGHAVTALPMVADERAKTLETARGLYDAMLAAAIPRGTPLLALGGGLVGDVAGFVAATYHRGLPLVQVPTTLLAMVDAAIGGKTGVNHPLPGSGVLGKNLIGAFWQPTRVVVDPRTLTTLDERHLRSGLGECVKHAMIDDAPMLAWLESNASAIADCEMDIVCELVERSARVKVGIVVEDVRETGRRALLNLGHTFAHAIEPIAELDLRHGEAVAIGLCAACQCAVAHAGLPQAFAASIERLLTTIGLPTRLASPVDATRLLELMRYDKKTSARGLRLVLPLAPGHVAVVDDVRDETVTAAWRYVGAA